MNTPRTMIAPLIAAIGVQGQRRVTAHFLAQHAISAEESVPYVPRGAEARQFGYLLDKGVVREAMAGSYWLDRAAYAALEERRRRVVMPIIATLLIAIAGLILLAY